MQFLRNYAFLLNNVVIPLDRRLSTLSHRPTPAAAAAAAVPSPAAASASSSAAAAAASPPSSWYNGCIQ